MFRLINLLALLAVGFPFFGGVNTLLTIEPTDSQPRNSEGDIIALRDGRLCLIYSRYRGPRPDPSKSGGGVRDHSPADLAMRTSSDGGKTWSDDRIVVTNDAGMNVMSVSLLRLRSGDIALFYLHKNSMEDCRPVIRVSKDECETWSKAVVCVPDQVGYFILSNDRAVELSDGRLVLPLALHRTPGAQADWAGTLLTAISDDASATWRRSQDRFQVFSPEGTRVTAQEPGIVELKDGRLLLYLRTNAGSQYISYSSDRGDTWTKAKPSKLASPLSPATIERIPWSGDLLSVWNDHSGRHPFSPRWRTPHCVAISRDDGESWEPSRAIERDLRGWFCYTSVSFHDDRVLLSYGAGDRYIGRLNRLKVLSISKDALESSGELVPLPKDYAWLEDDRLIADCLNFRAAEKTKFRAGGDLIALSPVALPRAELLERDPTGEPFDHFGWPVGVQAKGRLFVLFMKMTGHGKFDTGFVKAAMVSSTDGGRSFSPIPGLKNSCLDDLSPDARGIHPNEPRTNFGSWGNAAAFVDGKLIVTNFRGVYRSDDKGATWRLLDSSGLPTQIPTVARWGQGPRLFVHPRKGLVSIGATTEESLAFRSSLDYGVTWTEEIVPTEEPLQEPAGTVYDGKLILLPRHNRERWTQFWSETDWLPLRKARTNITPGERDTTDIQYNPVSKRLEAVVTNRIGGGPGHENDNCMTINLWSISPADLRAGRGEWRFDGTLLRSEGREHQRYRGLAETGRDGMHPGGTVIDAEKGVQYIYIYLGFFEGPAGVFQVKRTLDTDALRAYLLPQSD